MNNTSKYSHTTGKLKGHVVSDTGKKDKRWPRSVYSEGAEPDPRYALANERTFLAWIRTGLAFIAGGIALSAIPLDIEVSLRKGLAIASLAVGALLSMWAWISWMRVERAMRKQQPLPHSPMLIILSSLVLAFALIAAIAFTRS